MAFFGATDSTASYEYSGALGDVSWSGWPRRPARAASTARTGRRPMSWADMPDVRAIAHRTTAAGNKFSVMLMGVIESDQFQKRVKAN